MNIFLFQQYFIWMFNLLSSILCDTRINKHGTYNNVTYPDQYGQTQSEYRYHLKNNFVCALWIPFTYIIYKTVIYIDFLNTTLPCKNKPAIHLIWLKTSWTNAWFREPAYIASSTRILGQLIRGKGQFTNRKQTRWRRE